MCLSEVRQKSPECDACDAYVNKISHYHQE